VATAREAASGETFDRVVHLLTAQRQVELDKLLVVDDTVGSTRLAWLNKGPTEASASAVKPRSASCCTCAVSTLTRWTCQCCRPNAAGSWLLSVVG
jgi:hypothetical protein